MKNYMMKYKYLVLCALLFGAIYAVSTAYISIALRDVIDAALVKNEEAFYQVMRHTLVLLFGIGISYFLHALFSKRFIICVIRCLRKDVFSHVMEKNYRDFNSVNTADYISALTNDIKLIEDNYFMPMFECLNSIVLFVTSFIIMVSLSWAVTICLFISMILMIVIPSLFQNSLQRRQDGYSKKLAELTIITKDFLSGYQVIRSYQMGKYINSSFGENNHQVMHVKYAWEKMNAVVASLSALLGSFVQCSVLFLSAYFIIKGELSAGTLVGLVQISSMIALPIQTISTNLPKVQSTKLVIDKLSKHLQYQSTSFVGAKKPSFDQAIALANVSFAYGEAQPVVKEIDLVIEKNKKYVFVGKSGCGKTTLINLLCGNLDGYHGTICYDGVELSALSIHDVAQLSAVIHQSVYMFDDTIEHNINLYNQVPKARLDNALSISGVVSFLHAQKDLDTQVGENGNHLSGGQRQRVAVARALVQEKPLLILDEGTSAIDKQTAYDIENKLLSQKNITLITITHNLDEDLLKRYDQIVFMQDGCIVEKGSYDELMMQQGAFEQFYRIKKD